MAAARVLVVGLDPAKIEGWDPEPVQAALARGRARFGDHGIETDYCLVALDEDPEGAIVEALTRDDYACVVIGGGIRTHEPLLELFEKVVNLVRRHSAAAQGATHGSPLREHCSRPRRPLDAQAVHLCPTSPGLSRSARYPKARRNVQTGGVCREHSISGGKFFVPLNHEFR